MSSAVTDIYGRSIRVGDWVTCLKNCGGAFTSGKNYQVRDLSMAEWVRVTKDDSGDLNGWDLKNFTRAAYQGTPPDYEGILQSMKDMIAQSEEINRKILECQKILDS